MPSSSERRTSDSSMISSRQVKQGKGKRSIGIAQTSPTDVFGSRAGPPHSLCISVSMGLDRPVNQEPTQLFHMVRAAESMVAGDQQEFNRKRRIATAQMLHELSAAFRVNHRIS